MKNLDDIIEICVNKLVITKEPKETVHRGSIKYKCLNKCDGYNKKCNYYIARVYGERK